MAPVYAVKSVYWRRGVGPRLHREKLLTLLSLLADVFDYGLARAAASGIRTRRRPEIKVEESYGGAENVLGFVRSGSCQCGDEQKLTCKFTYRRCTVIRT
jgi:hypothetical protein